MLKSICAILLTSLAFTVSSHGDMGSIPFKKQVRITEPNQDAIIAWNGLEQLLFLQTTLASSEDTKVLEVMPLPNKPSVDEAKPEVFKRCQSLLPKIRTEYYADSFGGPFAAPLSPPAANVVERKLIGAHDIRVVELIDAKRFSDWVKTEFGATNEHLEIPAPLLEVIDEYVKDGYKWFIFDVVDLKQEAAKKTPLKIRFKTDKLYYPMRITRTEKGNTKVSLSILTNVLFDKEDAIGIPRSSFKVPASPIDITGEQVKWIDPSIFELLRQPSKVKLRTWEISGEIDSFKQDLLIRNPVLAKKQATRPNGK